MVVIGVEEGKKNEKEVKVVEGINNGGEEIKKEEGGDEKSKISVGRITKDETYDEYFAELSHCPSFANWLAAEARQARRRRRNGRRKSKGLEIQVVGDGEGRSSDLGKDEVLAPEKGGAAHQLAEGAQGSKLLQDAAASKSEDIEAQEEKVAEGVQGINCLQIATVLEPHDAEVQLEKVAEGSPGSNHLQTNADLESEDAEVQKEKVPEDAQGNNQLLSNAFLEFEDVEVQQQKVHDIGKGVSGNTSSLKEITEPTNHGNVQGQSGSNIDLRLSCAEEVEVTVNSTTEEENANVVKDDFIDLSEKEEQIENDSNLERTISLEVDQKDIIPVKLLGLQAEKDAELESTVSLEAQPADKKDIILEYDFQEPPTYFDLQVNSKQTSSSSGEDNNCHLQKKQQEQPVCYICGHLGHDGTKCKKVNKCLFCGKNGHLPMNCPQEEIVPEQTSNFCLRCANSGHDIFSCPNDYPVDDLEKIQCYVCKGFGHLCCANYGNEGPKSLSCYYCGESGHLGPECKKAQEKLSKSKRHKAREKHNKSQGNNEPTPALEHLNSEGERHMECHEKTEEASAPIPNIPTLAKFPQPKYYFPRFHLPYGFDYRHQNYVPWFDPNHWYESGPQTYIPTFNPPYVYHGTENYVPRFAPTQVWSQVGSNYQQPQRPFPGTYWQNTWQSPVTEVEGNNIVSSTPPAKSQINRKKE